MKKKFIIIVFIFLLTMLVGCKLGMPYDAKIITNDFEFNSEFLKDNLTKKEESEKLPQERNYYIDKQETLDQVFNTFPKTNFKKEMIILYGFTSSKNCNYELSKVSLDSKVLTIEIKPTNTAVSTMPFTEWIVIKMEKIKINDLKITIVSK
ncbi:MAG: hypothetical protein SOU07_06565 [Bacilli bacterium]|nr:hypothetical protein [Acholeplasmataceae bacterium]MDY2903085.1 hypothetical protein [Bacilli bacterium]